jgi:thioredoxin-related protein
MKNIYGLLLMIPFFGTSQDLGKGIHFEDSLLWQQVKEKAKAENKYIFMDCFTTWCGPCKYMSQNIFSLPEVGEFMNSNFISVGVQMDKTDSDRANVKNWYGYAKIVAEQYRVDAYPTYLFFSPDGQLVHRASGAMKERAEFITKASDALDPAKQSYTQFSIQVEKYKKDEGYREAHSKDSAFLINGFYLARIVKDYSTMIALGNAYLECITDLYAKDNMKLVFQLTGSIGDKGFAIILNSPQYVANILGISEGKVRGKLKDIIMKDEVINKIYNGHYQPIPADWAKIEKTLRIAYPVYADEILAEGKINYYKASNQWPEYGKAVDYYMNKYRSRLGNFQINNKAWDVFVYSNDLKLLKKAIVWMKPVIAQYPDLDWEDVDTYANLLYKAGDRHNAIIWENKAIDIAKDSGQKKTFVANLEKMKRNEKTWSE